MDPLFIVVVIAAIAALIGWWVMRRRRPLPTDDEWKLPPDSVDRSTLARPAAPLPPQRYDRDALVNRNRRFDPSRWDDGPDGESSGAAAETPGDLPRFFDRDYLSKQERKPAEEPEPGEKEGGQDA